MTNFSLVPIERRARLLARDGLIAEVTGLSLIAQRESVRVETDRFGRSIRCGVRRARWKTGGPIARAPI
jgi:hypothetical protein